MTETREDFPCVEEAGEGGVDGEPEGGREEGQPRVKCWRRRRVVVYEGLPACDDVGGTAAEDCEGLEGKRENVTQEADVWAAMRGVEMDI